MNAITPITARERQRIIDKLIERGVPFQIAPDGTIEAKPGAKDVQQIEPEWRR